MATVRLTLSFSLAYLPQYTFATHLQRARSASERHASRAREGAPAGLVPETTNRALVPARGATAGVSSDRARLPSPAPAPTLLVLELLQLLPLSAPLLLLPPLLFSHPTPPALLLVTTTDAAAEPIADATDAPAAVTGVAVMPCVAAALAPSESSRPRARCLRFCVRSCKAESSDAEADRRWARQKARPMVRRTSRAARQ